jgi:hypothetical protein
MACGCKNKGNQSQPAPQQAQVQQTQQSSSSSPIVKESVKDTKKKTIEKYYNVNKTNK